MRKEPPGYPVLLAFPTVHGYGDRAGLDASVWCPHCRCWHYHGWGDGPRAAHCVGGPFEETGYIVRGLTRTKAREMIRSLQRYLLLTERQPRRGEGVRVPSEARP